MIITARSDRKVQPLSINENAIIKQVNEIKLLGVTTDRHLTFTKHVENCRRKGNQRIFWLRTLKKHGGRDTGLIQLYQSNIRSLFEYASPAWYSHTSKSLRSIIERVEKCALKVIFADLSYNEALKKCGMPPILTHLEGLGQRYFLGMRKSCHPLHHLIPAKNEDTSGRKTRTGHHLRVPQHRSALRSKCFIVTVSKELNSMAEMQTA